MSTEAHEILARRMLREAGFDYLLDDLQFVNGVAILGRALTDEEREAVAPIISGALRPVWPANPDRGGA